ncbi:flavin reductase [Micromonospora sp. WMMD1102]|uniref:flavin reductase n=1 Tax=Micromonospora sp. WMMD1102 TaxID=3016105 RepID=UPI0024152D8B|nr:flavin reductase [Micromonospora sp. WMMD1102]MDG4790314.1 flavin reductase [Micromonospora sp. WMMD1102]
MPRDSATASDADGHTPADTYDCLKCEYPWPCPQARLALLLGFAGDRVGLMIYLGARLARALEALPDRHPALIVGQILHWVPRRN